MASTSQIQEIRLENQYIIINNYNNTIIRTIGYTPTEASNNFIQSMLINKAQDKTNEMENKEIKYNIGDKCRIKEQTKYLIK